MRRRRWEPGASRTSLKRSTRAQERRVTLTAARKSFRSNREGPREISPRPPDMTGNVQLYLTAREQGSLRMGGPLVGFG